MTNFWNNGPGAGGLGTALGVDAIAEFQTLTNTYSTQFGGNGAVIAPGARVDDGLLDLVVFEERSRLRTIGHLPRLFNGTVECAKGCSIRRITHATIETDPQSWVPIELDTFNALLDWLQNAGQPGGALAGVVVQTVRQVVNGS